MWWICVIEGLFLVGLSFSSLEGSSTHNEDIMYFKWGGGPSFMFFLLVIAKKLKKKRFLCDFGRLYYLG